MYISAYTFTHIDISHYFHIYLNVFNVYLVTLSYLTVWDAMDCSPPGSSVHEVFQAIYLNIYIKNPLSSHWGLKPQPNTSRFFLVSSFPCSYNTFSDSDFCCPQYIYLFALPINLFTQFPSTPVIYFLCHFHATPSPQPAVLDISISSPVWEVKGMWEKKELEKEVKMERAGKCLFIKVSLSWLFCYLPPKPCKMMQPIIVQSLSWVQPSASPWTAAHQHTTHNTLLQLFVCKYVCPLDYELWKRLISLPLFFPVVSTVPVTWWVLGNCIWCQWHKNNWDIIVLQELVGIINTIR